MLLSAANRCFRDVPFDTMESLCMYVIIFMNLEAHPVIAAERWVTSSGLTPPPRVLCLSYSKILEPIVFFNAELFSGVISESSDLKSLLFGLCVRV